MIDLSNEQSWVIVMVNNIMIEVLSSIAEQEYNTIHQRQSEGIAAAKAKGKHLGRPKLIKPDNWDSVISEYKETASPPKRQWHGLTLNAHPFINCWNPRMKGADNYAVYQCKILWFIIKSTCPQPLRIFYLRRKIFKIGGRFFLSAPDFYRKVIL